MEEVIMATLPNKELNRLIKIEIAVDNFFNIGSHRIKFTVKEVE